MLARVGIAALCIGGFCAFDVPPFNVADLTKAEAGHRQAMNACVTRTDYKSIVDGIDCFISADRDFTAAIHLRDRSSFDSYAAKVKTVCDGVTAGTMTAAEAKNRFLALQKDFFLSLRDQYSDYQSRMAMDMLRDGGPAPSAPMDGMGAMNPMGGM